MKSFSWLFLLSLICVFFVTLSVPAQAQVPSTRILLIPLDDRPPCLQFPVRMGLIADAEIVTPPRELLGRFTDPGKPDRIIEWLKTQDLKSFEAAIVSVDMLAYGGLVAMRSYQTDAATALRRLEFVREMRKLAPAMKIYGSSVIMRLAPTGDGKNEAYREHLAKWAEISVDPNLKKETAELESKIPAEALTNYKNARSRDLQINQQTVSLTRDKVFDYLILSQDDAKPKGVHVADRENLIGLIKKSKLGERIAVQPGADEVSMLLLARALTDRYDYHPKIKVVYSSEKAAGSVMPFEDRPLRETIGYHIKATGSREVDNEKDADLLFYVYASRFETGSAENFAGQIEEKIKRNKKIIVADIDPKGDVQGGDLTFTSELGRRHLLSSLNSYASWNTAGNTIGTTLPQGVIFGLAGKNLLNKSAAGNERSARILTAQSWFTFHRVLDDYYFHNVIRAQAKAFIAQKKWSALRLSDEATGQVEAYSLNLLKDSFAGLTKDYFTGSAVSQNPAVKCDPPSDLRFALPWNRTFEAEINFNLQCRIAPVP